MVPCSGDVWVESSPTAGLFAEAQPQFSPVEGDMTLSVDTTRQGRADAG